MSSTISTQKKQFKYLAMKRKKIVINEALLLSKAEEAQVRGGERYRWRAGDGSKMKVITKND